MSTLSPCPSKHQQPERQATTMSDLDNLPLIRCKPQPVPVGHPEHPDFCGYDEPAPDADEDGSNSDQDDLADTLAAAWWRK